MKNCLCLTGLRLSLAGVALLFCLALSGADAPADKLQDTMHARFGSDGAAMLQAWREQLQQAANLGETEQLKQINDFFNHNIRFRDDIDHWQQSDYWATPLETLGSRAADCEDYTIAKYMSLIKLGVPRERLRLIYVRAQIGGSYSQNSQAHMVLGYYASPGAMPLILDNLVSRIQPAIERNDLKPVFSFNSEGLWVGDSLQSQADPTARLSRWRDLLTRVQQEGFYE